MMKIELTWLAHNAWRLCLGGTTFAVDPFFQLPDSPENGSMKADYVLLSHGHADHCADAEAVLKKNNATLIAMAEVAGWFSARGVKKCEAMNIGGSVPVCVDGGKTEIRIMMVSASHSSTMPDGCPGGNSCGFLISIPKEGNNAGFSAPFRPFSEIAADCRNIYFACDTGWTAEMPWLGSLGIEMALLPIGDRYTLGPALSLDVIAVLKPQKVVPCHYNSWPPIRQDVQAWSEAVQKQGIAKPVLLKPGERYLF